MSVSVRIRCEKRGNWWHEMKMHVCLTCVLIVKLMQKKIMLVNRLKWGLILISVRGVTNTRIKTSDSYMGQTNRNEHGEAELKLVLTWFLKKLIS